MAPQVSLASRLMILLKCISSPRTNQVFFILSGKHCNKIPILTDIEDWRTKRVFEKLGQRGYFKVPVVLDSEAFKKCFTLDLDKMLSNDRDNVEGKSVDGINTLKGDKGESRQP